MSDNQEESVDDGEVKTGTGSNEDENLLQNWSLTFTDYRYGDACDIPEKRSDNRTQSESRNRTELVDDGRMQHTNDVIPKTDVTEATYGQTLESGIPKVNESEHRASEKTSEKGSSRGQRDEPVRPEDMEETDPTEVQTKSVDSKRSRDSGDVTHHAIDDTTQTDKPNSIQQNEQMFQNNLVISKYNVLPVIDKKSQTQTSDRVVPRKVPEKSTARSVGAFSGNKAPRNTPATGGGKVQQVYVRFPGQRTGQMMFAEMNQQAGQVRIVGHDKDREMLARLAWLLLDAGTSALRATFDSIHPPLSLRDHLKQAHVRAVLQRLLTQGVLTDKQWKMLYPIKKKHSTSQQYDSRTLVILLETICHLCPPYPHGWSVEPLPKDGSLSADIVRLQLLFAEIARHEGIPGEAYVAWFIQIRDVIIRLGGPPIRLKIGRIENELINLDLQQHYIKTLREVWQPDSVQKLEKVHELRSKTSKARKAYSNAKGGEEGLSPEDRVTLKKTWKVLVETVQADDVIDRLQQSQVIKFSDRQEILGTNRKQERMQLLLDKIVDSKLPYALKALFDAMKFKYKKLYEHCMAIRKQTYKEGVVNTVDVAGITAEGLKARYKSMFCRVFPFPWSDSVQGTVREIYTPLDIVDSDGKKLSSKDLLPSSSVPGRGSRVVLEGESGSGKSVLCAWLTYTWATQEHYFRANFKHLIYLNVSILRGDLETAIYYSLFPDNFKIGINEFWKMLENKASGVLVVIDGYDRDSGLDISNILAGSCLKEATVLITCRPNSIAPSVFVPDTKWFNLGLSDANIKRCFRTFVNLNELEHDDFEKLYHLAGRDTWALRPHLSNPMLAVMAFGVYLILRKGTMLRDMKTPCDLLEKYGVAMATQYCRTEKIDILGFEFPDEVLRAIEALDMFAYRSLMMGTHAFRHEDVLRETSDPIVLRFGAFSKFTQHWPLQFTSGISLDFLAARHIADMAYEELETAVLKNKMVKLHKYTQLMSFLCGQYRDDTDTQVLQALADQLAARNEYCVRGFYLPATPIHSPLDSSVSGKEKVPRGVLEDFVTSLQVLAECPARTDVVETITQSLPQRLIIKTEGIVALKTLQGLCLALNHAECTVQEIELTFHQYHFFQLPALLNLATATGNCRSISSLKITWSSLDVMAAFLENVMNTTETIESVVLVEDTNRKPVKQISAATWAALQSACSSMRSVKRLAFLNGRVTSVVNHVLQHVPDTIVDLDVTGSAFNLMCAGQIASYLHGNLAIRFLDLSYTRLNSSEFVAIFQGMQMCEGISVVRVRGARLDRPCLVALAEYIKLTHSLQELDLSECELTTEMCTQLVAAIRQNRTLTRLVFRGANITREGRKVISQTTTRLQPVAVEGLVRIY